MKAASKGSRWGIYGKGIKKRKQDGHNAYDETDFFNVASGDFLDDYSGDVQRR